MSLKAGKNGRIYLKGYDISGKANRFNITLLREFEDVTGFGNSGHKWHPTLHNNSFGFDAFYDTATGNIAEIMNALRSTSGIACLCLGSAHVDKAIAGHGVFQQDYPIEMPVDGMIKITGDFVFSDMALKGYILQAKNAQTANGTGSVATDAASSTDGCEGFLHVFDCGATDNLVVKIQDSTATAAGWADLIAFSAASGVTSERATATGTVNRYTRVTWTADDYNDVNFAVIFSRL